MAFSSISKMSVTPPGVDGQAPSQGMLMPKLAYRFRILFDNFGISKDTFELSKQVVTASRPTVNFEEIAVHTYNSIVYLAGKPSFETISITVRDDATGAIARLVGEQLQKQFDFSEHASAVSGTDYKFGMRIQMLDGGNGKFEEQVLEQWELYGCIVMTTNYSDLDYSQSDVSTIDMTIRFDNAVQTPADNNDGLATGAGFGVGMDVGRTQRDTVSGIGA
jgi:hypothetical protein